LYVLSDIGAVAAPYVYERAQYGDTATVTLGFAFDSVRIVDDTTFQRHFRREIVVTRSTIPPIVQSSEEFTFGGLILAREDEIKLTVRTGSLPGGHDLAYFTPVGGGTGLERTIQVRQYSCNATTCVLVGEQRARARYERR